MIASCLIRPQPAFRREAFASGLQSLGYSVRFDAVQHDPRPHDVLVTWNRLSFADSVAARYEHCGAKVLVAENGYLGRERDDGIWYALARGQHNGAGDWPDGGPGRWDAWDVDLKPWREDGEEIVILAQRGIGSKELRSPPGWERGIRAELQKRTKRPIRIREHPGRHPEKVPLADDLRKAWACVTWASAAGLKAILLGVPVFHACPSWIGKTAAMPIDHDLESPFLDDRLPMFRRLAWAMWTTDELASGEPFRLLLQ